MSRSFFEFKQFKVFHDRCAMKVGTDGVLLGAWVDINNAHRALDIGTGSGLIALMLAQRTNDALKIDAIDISEEAISQAAENISLSPFKNIRAQNKSLSDFTVQSTEKYDLIVSNPPFFSSSLVSPDTQRTLARHTQTLSITDLFVYSKLLLTANGRLSFIYPYDAKDSVLEEAQQDGYCLKRLTSVFAKPDSSIPKRGLFEFGLKEDEDIIFNDLVLELSRHIYSAEFTSLVKDFYLKL